MEPIDVVPVSNFHLLPCFLLTTGSCISVIQLDYLTVRCRQLPHPHLFPLRPQVDPSPLDQIWVAAQAAIADIVVVAHDCGGVGAFALHTTASLLILWQRQSGSLA